LMVAKMIPTQGEYSPSSNIPRGSLKDRSAMMSVHSQ
jgi:hypothetical protein